MAEESSTTSKQATTKGKKAAEDKKLADQLVNSLGRDIKTVQAAMRDEFGIEVPTSFARKWVAFVDTYVIAKP